jgi:multidrug efflux pump subunit AcrA (membrane-fusion protein)
MRLTPSKRSGLLLAIAALAITAIARTGAHQGAAAVWTEVERRDLHRETPFAGRLRALQVAEYGPPTLNQIWEYRITFLAPEGSVVEAGEPVLRFDSSELEQSLRRHLADRDAARKEYEQRSKSFEAEISEQELALEEAKTQERRAQITADVPPELVARTKLEKAAVDLELARNEVVHRQERIEYLKRRSHTELNVLRDRRDRAALAVTETEHAIGLMTVRATAKGTVSHRANRRGQKKKVGETCWRGDRVLEIPEPGALRLDAWVKEADSGALRTGLPATLRLDAHPDRAFRAKVHSVQQTVERHSELDPGAIVRLELSFDDVDPELVRPGMRVQGAIRADEYPARLAVPVAAVAAASGGPEVTRKTFLRSVTRPVVLGRRSGNWVEVVEGVEEGDWVLMLP